VETALRVAQENYNAALQTLEQGTVGREEEIQANEAEVRSLEGRVVEAAIEMDDTTLRAPYDGVIAQRFVEQGQNVSARQQVIKFQDVNEITIALDIPEAVMSADLRSADIVNLDANFSAAPGLQFPVHITEIAQRADPVTQTFRVRAAMQAPSDFNLLPGMTATVTIAYRRALVLGQQIVVPITALFQESPLSQVVWVIGTDGTVSRRQVKTGDVTGGGIEILEGIQPGDRVAVAGVSFLRDGMKVRDLGNGLSTGQP
jgi:RND family efflux transporter MFP subunit